MSHNKLLKSLSQSGNDLEPSENLLDLIQRIKGKKGAFHTKLAEKLANIDPKYTSKRLGKTVEDARAIAIPPSFQPVISTTDSVMSGSYVLMSVNRSSRIYRAISSIIFHSTDALMTSHAKLIYMRQMEREYNSAKESGDRIQTQKYIRMVKLSLMGYDEPWFDDEWLLASKAFFAPIHVKHRCSRVPTNPHVKRYAFSPVLESESPIRIILDNGDFLPGQ